MPAFSSVGWDCMCRNYITEKTVQEPDGTIQLIHVFSVRPKNHMQVHIFCIIQLNYLFFHAD